VEVIRLVMREAWRYGRGHQVGDAGRVEALSRLNHTLAVLHAVSALLSRKSRGKSIIVSSLFSFVESPDGHMRMMIVFCPFQGEELASRHPHKGGTCWKVDSH
jgi:hypothetical protein